MTAGAARGETGGDLALSSARGETGLRPATLSCDSDRYADLARLGEGGSCGECCGCWARLVVLDIIRSNRALSEGGAGRCVPPPPPPPRGEGGPTDTGTTGTDRSDELKDGGAGRFCERGLDGPLRGLVVKPVAGVKGGRGGRGGSDMARPLSSAVF